MAAPVDLDLAFAADPELGPELRRAAGAWLDPLEGADLWHSLLSGWLGQLASELPPQLRAPAYSLGLSLVGDAEIAALNADWRAQDGPTDVLAFAARDEGLDDTPPLPMPSWADPEDDPAGSRGPAEPLELGDIVISVETASRQAPGHGHGLERELRFLASHGLLHLLGWDHPDEASLTAMLARQERLLTTPGQPE
ncbi:rRNA maturation RNase YbeY [Cyanobium sp. CH-040]|uniref:rRNA maturation RNase YbeY n=1 Tax=Cyanobium sp. CH-040 TaxID=2823708 RepID=UPI0020CC501E|nr:rRNA maturation RNase YbeY [Cyanobium sp. CH-040]MCP9926701.1 rRNA maturation RNase YbeY [Cyanobium sp. CH-040]